jgi:hypothetical protein
MKTEKKVKDDSCITTDALFLPFHQLFFLKKEQEESLTTQ